MKVKTRENKVKKIIASANQIFAKFGYKNTRMEDIASVAGITKVTLYTYFQSKENLYLAVTFYALRDLVTEFRKTLKANAGKTGLESTLELFKLFIEFCEKNYFYSELLLDYFSLVRSTVMSENHLKLTESMKESEYFEKLKKIHNLPFKLTANEIARGISDGSIRNDLDPMYCTLQGWAMAIGYTKLITASGEKANQLFNIDLQKLKDFNLELTKQILSKTN